MTLQDHYDAFATRLRASVEVDVEDGVRKTLSGAPVRANFFVVTLDLPRLNDRRYTAQQTARSTAVYRFDVRGVATTQVALLKNVQAARDGLLAQVLTVPGRVCDPIRLVDPVEEGRIRYDRTADLLYADETYELVSRPAPEE